MMNKLIKRIVLGCLATVLSFSAAVAQNNHKNCDHQKSNAKCCDAKKDTSCCSKGAQANDSVHMCKTQGHSAQEEAYDPLIPQRFVFDKSNNVFGAINAIDNMIDIIHYEKGNLVVSKRILVDEFEGRHDVHYIYRPQGIAIYENHLVFLASHRDSCYLAVLDMQGNIMKKLYFRGSATAFSYSKTAQEMYIAGENAKGYDLIAISTANGIENISLSNSPSLHYQKPQKAADIVKADPIGIGMAMVAMGVVFIGLLILTVVFGASGKVLSAFQNMQAGRFLKSKSTDGSVTPALAIKKPSNMSGEEFAAIAAALYMYNNELHDQENAILTFQNKARSWTPWNAKYFGMNNYFKNR